MKQFVEIKGNQITFDLEYYNSLFIQPNEQGNISGLMVRLMALLVIELSFYEYRKLPSRRNLSKILGANESSIHKCLVLLEDLRFFKRSVDPMLENMVRADEEEQRKYSEFYAERNKSRRGGFGDYFILNSNYQDSKKVSEEPTELILNKMLQQRDETVIDNEEGYNNSEIIEMIIQNFLKGIINDRAVLKSLIKKSIV